MDNNLKKLQLKIHGTHCASCEVLIEQKWKNLPGVKKVEVRHATGRATVFSSRDLSLRDLEDVIKGNGYSISLWKDRHVSPQAAKHANTSEDYMQIGAVVIIILNLYLILQSFGFLPNGLAIPTNMGYIFAFLIGLVASVSTCLAVTGGLLLASAAKYSEMYPNLTGYQKFKPAVYFNIGRVVSYTLLGGLVGLLGSAISLSAETTAVLSAMASLVMIILGFQMLNLFPWLRHIQPRMPKFIAHKIHDWGGESGQAGAFTIGALTFFLPCGFTQALQLYVLAKGSFTVGALTMLFFSLGTLPILMSISVISSFAKGTFQKHFVRFSAVLVIIVGFWNINNSLALAGLNIDLLLFAPKISGSKASAQSARVENGKQIVEMRVEDYSYFPSQFIVKRGVPVEWRIDGSKAAGCAQVIVAPSIGVSSYLPPSKTTVIEFTPKENGFILFSCSMGMTTKGAGFKVVNDTI